MPASRLPYAFGTALVAVLSLAATGFATLVQALATCSGDGGEPYSADPSLAGRFCSGPVAAPYFVLQVAVPVLLVVVLGVLATVRLSWRPFWVGVAAATTIFLVMALTVAVLPNECSEEQLRDHPRRCTTY